jgi:two-component system sensor histidine kinase VanS
MLKAGMFRKIFFYTLLFLVVVIGITAALFSQQFVSFYDTRQLQQLNTAFQPLTYSLNNKTIEEVIKISTEFYERNQSFTFSIETADEEIIYSTPGMEKSTQQTLLMALPQGLVLRVVGLQTGSDTVKAMVEKTLFALAILLIIGTIGAALFARGITKPIRKLAEDTHKMAALEDVSISAYGRDEIGRLGRDVHNMYEKLKQTINALEKEIDRVHEMEETQRYFFSAASHELKTPIAAASVMVEGMLSDIGEYKNHPKYLRECMKMLKAQGKIISEIMDIVNLSDGMILPSPERINLCELIDSILPEYHTLAERKEQTIDTAISDDIYCYADQDWLGRVISNILMNAVQNSPEQERIRIWSDEKTDAFTLYFLNTGVTIEKEIMGKLFEPFFRADKARSNSSGRSGLGLTIVKKLLDAMNIPFSLDNSDEGVLFMLELKKQR